MDETTLELYCDDYCKLICEMYMPDIESFQICCVFCEARLLVHRNQ